MGSGRRDESSLKAIEGELVDSGNRLFRLRSSTDDLLPHVERVERLLAQVWQKPPMSTCRSLLPLMKALMTDEVSRHHNLNVQIALASCFNELTRITAPDPPYDDDLMLVFFRLYMIAFKQLPCETGPNFSRALKILETMAKVRSSLMLLDIDTDGSLIVEMVQLFLDNIRSSHPFDVFQYMEMIMTMVIQESDSISNDLLIPLLASVKMENKDISPISWELGKKIFENCAAKLHRCLREAVRTMNLKIEDYAEIVGSIIHDASLGRNMVSEEVAPTVGDVASPSDEVPNAINEDSDAQANNDSEATESDNEKSSEKIKDNIGRRRRGRKPNSLIRPEEGYKGSWTTGGKSADLSSDGILSNSSEKRNDSFSEGSILKRDQPKKKKSKDNDVEFSSALKRKISQSKVEKGQNSQKKIGNGAIAGSSSNGVEKEGGKYELLSQEQNGRKENNMEEFSMSKPAKAKGPSKNDKEKSRKPRVACGEELVNLRIQVWWPMDETFYTGTVKDFDPVTKKHTILYDDDETETLNLRKETWELFVEPNTQKQEADVPSLPKELIKTRAKPAKRKSVSSRKENATSSSKRSKSEDCSVDKNAAPEIINVDDNDACETNVSTKDGENLASKEESGTFVKKTEVTAIPI
ncbi:hypothetical protein ACP275_09G093500 [Erythranthe tilingii]